MTKSRTKPGRGDEFSRLREKLNQRETELDLINSVQLGLASHLEVQAIYDLVGDKIRDIFNAQVVMISPYDPQTDTVEHRYAIERGERVYSPGPRPPGGFRSKIIRTRQPVLVNRNVAEEAARLGQPTLPGTVTPKSWLGVPMMVGGQVTGILSLQNVEEENVFTEFDVRLLQTIAASMSVALENARLWEQEHLYRQALEREFEIGREIQESFLPESLPQPPGWELAAFIKSAREVAGDFYDAFEFADGKIGLVIADVCDKGLGAALFMTLFRSLLRAVSNIDLFERAGRGQALSPAARLESAISLTNNYIAETHGRTGMFATIFFGILDPENGLLTYINGGHLPPMIIGPHGLKHKLSLTGPAVGALLAAEYETREVCLEPGDLFFGWTDGLTEVTNPAGKYFSVEKLLPLLAQPRPIPDLLAEIHTRLESFTAGAKQFDDITMLSIRRITKSNTTPDL
jgi:sigma-B regulation protein RsbU (phosphoserine phosphatase)